MAPAGGPLTARVITVSTRAAAGQYADEAGPIAVAALTDLGFDVPQPVVVPDGDAVTHALRSALAESVDVIVTNGGTGVAPTDHTPDLTRQLLDYEVPGIAEQLRITGAQHVPTAALSRGVAGVADRTLVVNLPGSVGGVRDGMAVLSQLLPHAVDQLRGGDHARHAHRHSVDGVVLRAEVTNDVIDVATHENLVARPDAGAVVGFAGVVRNHDHGREVNYLEYVGHPSAADVIADVAKQVAARADVLAVAVSHRLGELKIGEVALAGAVATAHRGDAFAACKLLVDEVKRQLPVWKRQVFSDGSDEWVNCP